MKDHIDSIKINNYSKSWVLFQSIVLNYYGIVPWFSHFMNHPNNSIDRGLHEIGSLTVNLESYNQANIL